MSRAVITAIATHVPERVLTNEELEARGIGLTAAQILDKTGIEERRIAAPDECASDLAYQAARKLINQGALKPEEVDYVLFCTQSPDYFLPTSACLLQERLGLPRTCGAMDYNQGCSGYVVGLSLAKGLIESQQAQCVLLLTGETYSKHIHPQDRSVCTLFGDGGTATVIRWDETTTGGLGQFVFGTDGRGGKNLMVRAGGFRMPRSEATAQETVGKDGTIRSDNHLYMNGPEIFRFAIQVVPQTVNLLLEKAGLKKEELDYVILHQANRYMLDTLSRKLQLPKEKVPYEFAGVGNTVSCTIPIVLERMMQRDELRGGARCLLVGFGVGYSWAGAVVTWH